MEAKATLKTYRQSPRKVRLLAGDLVGQSLDSVKVTLEMAPKRVAPVLLKLIKSAEANAREKKMNTENLRIERFSVDKGPTMFRMRPRAYGRAFVIRKRTSHISVVLVSGEEDVGKNQKKESVKKEGLKDSKTQKVKSKKKVAKA